MEEAEHVVEALPVTGNREYGCVRDLARRASKRQVAVEEHDVAARAHHLAERALGRVEDVRTDLPLVLGRAPSWVMTRSRSSSLAHLLARRRRVAAEQRTTAFGGERQQPDHRAHERREPVQRRPDDQRERRPTAAARAASAPARRAPARGRRSQRHHDQCGRRGRRLGHAEAGEQVGATSGASVEAPYAAEKKPATVTPIWTAARNRLGSRATAATRAPRAPRAPAGSAGCRAATPARSRWPRTHRRRG